MLRTIVIVTLVKALLAVAVVDHPRRFEDHDLAVGFVRDGEFARLHLGQLNHTIQFPIYPLAVTSIYRVAGIRPSLVLVFNLVIAGLAAWLFLEVATRWLAAFDAEGRTRRSAPTVLWLTLAGFLVYPPLQQYLMAAVHPMAIDLTVFYLTIWAGYVYLERGERPRDLLWLGGVAGLVLLTRTVMLVAFLPLLLSVGRRRGWGVALRQVARVLAVALLLGVPWLVHTYTTDHIVGYTSTTGEILWKGVRPGADGSNYDDTGLAYGDAFTPERRASLEAMSVAEQNRFFLGEYLRIVRAEPARVVTMYGRKLRNFFWFRAGTGGEYGVVVRRWLPLYKLVYGAMLASAVLAFVVFGRRAWAAWLPVAALGAVQAVFYVETRHRVLVEPVLLFLALATFVALVASWRDRRRHAGVTP